MDNEYHHIIMNTDDFKMVSKVLPSVALRYKQPFQRKTISNLR
jgi:hypothetical protein